MALLTLNPPMQYEKILIIGYRVTNNVKCPIAIPVEAETEELEWENGQPRRKSPRASPKLRSYFENSEEDNEEGSSDEDEEDEEDEEWGGEMRKRKPRKDRLSNLISRVQPNDPYHKGK